MTNLCDSTCEPCRIGAPLVTKAEQADLLTELKDWNVKNIDGVDQLIKVYKFKNFVDALAFTNLLGELAEEHGHHPGLLTEWGKVTVTWWTHKINGLHKNDFILAAKTEQVFSEGPGSLEPGIY
ncbi:4a-hydroxytetrahydrobiopterin dehydratase [Catenovulum sp. SM1970]|uniref:4a-hydroxytetrahydrobiopterin dehydratase n=1 Tax=Marinifaba aquimaris TaxID=2741323 RepID=UPI001571FC72|nr:4a-hydroxytetrahydrobiopterin dehydratase [Marinifaba aquimaris]NTS75277.1 4a-hydroxytetrahydrobiopterin dehydratase [Marinifaba aquimaris]